MDIIILAILIATGTFMLNAKEQRKRIALLGKHLANYQIEKLMEALTDGYLRALGESTDERRSQIWSLLSTTESQLSEQFSRFAADFAKVDEAHARVSRLSVPIPFADKLLPAMTTLCIGSGRKDKLRPGDILGALTGKQAVAGTDVGKIALFDTRAYVGIRRAVADKALQTLRQDKIKGRNFRVRVLDH